MFRSILLLLVTAWAAAGGAAAAGAPARRSLTAALVEPNGTSTSSPEDPQSDPVLTTALRDWPLDAPPLVRTAVGWEPEAMHLTLWGPGSVLVSWQTGGERP